jgi:hypothetical protein
MPQNLNVGDPLSELEGYRGLREALEARPAMKTTYAGAPMGVDSSSENVAAIAGFAGTSRVKPIGMGVVSSFAVQKPSSPGRGAQMRTPPGWGDSRLHPVNLLRWGSFRL